MADRSRRPHRSPRRTPPPLVREIVHLRWTQRLGPARIAPEVGLAPSTVHAVLVRCRINRLSHLDRATGQPIRRDEHATPGALVHIDIKQFGSIPAGGVTGSWVGTAGKPTARPTTTGGQCSPTPPAARPWVYPCRRR